MTDLLTAIGVILLIGFLALIGPGFWAIGLVQFMEWIFS